MPSSCYKIKKKYTLFHTFKTFSGIKGMTCSCSPSMALTLSCDISAPDNPAVKMNRKFYVTNLQFLYIGLKSWRYSIKFQMWKYSVSHFLNHYINLNTGTSLSYKNSKQCFLKHTEISKNLCHLSLYITSQCSIKTLKKCLIISIKYIN